MDPTNTTSPEVPTPEPEKKDGHWVAIAAMALFVIASLVAIGFLYYQNQQLKTMLAGYQTQTTPTPVATVDPTAGWKTYTNEGAGFSFRYPSEITLKISEQGLYWLNATGNFQTDIYWNSLPLTGTLEEEITTRNDCPKEVTNGLIHGPIPNSLRCDYSKSHYTSVDIWIANGKKVYKAVIGAINPNQPVSEADINLLNQILSTFKFQTTLTASPSGTQKACTEEAKLCPDGSSVGRTGPNCEFAACP